MIGTIGGGKAKPTGKIDIAVMQSLSRQGEVNPLVERYGHVIVDEYPRTHRAIGIMVRPFYRVRIEALPRQHVVRDDAP